MYGGGFDARYFARGLMIIPAGSRPMSAIRLMLDGAVAGALVLESLESALERGATIYAESTGGGGGGDGSY